MRPRGRRLGCWLGLAVLVMAVQPCGPARADTLVADLSEHLIAITTAFVGTTVTLFGTAEADADIAVTVIGPRENQVVRRKERMAGVWINRDRMTFGNVPSFFAVASTRPLEEMARPDVIAQLELSVHHLQLQPVDTTGREIGEILAFEDALIRNKQRQGLYTGAPGTVRFLGPSLFRTNIAFPANVPPGLYQVQVYELRDGQVSDAQRSTLVVSKVGFEAEIYDFAQQRAPLYGLVAILVAVTSGWLAGVIFRRG